MQYSVTIPGVPIAKARPRMTKSGHTYTPKKTADYETMIKQAFMIANGTPILEGEIKMRLEFFFPITKSTRKRDIDVMLAGDIRPAKKPDIDNLMKAVCDALNGVAYKDDAQIVDIEVAKYYDVEPRVDIEITEINRG